ncbi:MAG: 3-oxoacyl-ACP synthase, partial [Bacteroidota bacterium]
LEACRENIEKRIASLQETLQSIEQSMKSETKSSAGDKYETGRSMLHMEEAKNKNLLFEAYQVKRDLLSVEVNNPSEKVEVGSLVETNQGIYYISIGLGQVRLDGKVYYCISNKSPVGRKLIRQEVGNVIEFNGRKITIEGVW